MLSTRTSTRVTAVRAAQAGTAHLPRPRHRRPRWIFADALVTAAAAKSPFAFYYCLPGIVATLGVILLGAVGRPEDSDYYVYGDDGEACRAKCSLFVAVRGAGGTRRHGLQALRSWPRGWRLRQRLCRAVGNRAPAVAAVNPSAWCAVCDRVRRHLHRGHAAGGGQAARHAVVAGSGGWGVVLRARRVWGGVWGHAVGAELSGGGRVQMRHVSRRHACPSSPPPLPRAPRCSRPCCPQAGCCCGCLVAATTPGATRLYSAAPPAAQGKHACYAYWRV